MGKGWPRAGGLENQDPAYLQDLQTIYKLRHQAHFELWEEGDLEVMDNEAKALGR